MIDMLYIVAPSEKFDLSLLEDAIIAANNEADIRIKNHPGGNEVNSLKEGSFYTSGLLPLRHGKDKVARCGLAWFTDNNGYKHVRLVADVFVPKSYRKVSPWNEESVFGKVYEQCRFQDGNYIVRCDNCGNPSQLNVGTNKQRCLACREAERYEQETGFKPGR